MGEKSWPGEGSGLWWGVGSEGPSTAVQGNPEAASQMAQCTPNTPHLTSLGEEGKHVRVSREIVFAAVCKCCFSLGLPQTLQYLQQNAKDRADLTAANAASSTVGVATLSLPSVAPKMTVQELEELRKQLGTVTTSSGVQQVKRSLSAPPGFCGVLSQHREAGLGAGERSIGHFSTTGSSGEREQDC